MCIGSFEEKSKSDAAMELAKLLSIGHVEYDQHLRRMIREHWSKVKMLAHQIHDEETSTEARISRAAQALRRDPGSVSSFMDCVSAAGLKIVEAK